MKVRNCVQLFLFIFTRLTRPNHSTSDKLFAATKLFPLFCALFSVVDHVMKTNFFLMLLENFKQSCGNVCKQRSDNMQVSLIYMC